MVALFDVEVRDAAEGGGADVHNGLGLDLAGAADGGDKVSVNGLGGGYGGHVRAAVQHRSDNYTGHNKHDDDDQQNFLTGHGRFLLRRASSATRHKSAVGFNEGGYAGRLRSVP